MAPPEAAPRVVIARPAVLNALYEQGLAALQAGDYAGAIAALTPVAREAPAAYPDVRPLLDRAVRQRLGTAAATGRRLGAIARGQVRRLAPAVSPWLDVAAACWQRAVAAGRPVADQWLARAPAPLREAVVGRVPAPVWGIGALVALAVLVGVLLPRGSPSTAPVAPPPAAPVPTRVPNTALFAQCDGAVAAEDWAEAIRTCRILRARDPTYAGVADRLAVAYVGRGQQRLRTGGDLAEAKADFEQALAFQPESADAERAWRQLNLYQEGTRALDAGDWEAAVGQLSAVHTEAPDYLQALGERSLTGRLFAAWLGWGRAALEVGDAASAAARCQQALGLVPEDPGAQECVAAAQAVLAPPEASAAADAGLEP